MEPPRNPTPLYGWTVVSLRPGNDVRALAAAVRAAGGCWIGAATLRIVRLPAAAVVAALDAALQAPLLVATSPHAVRAADHIVPLAGWRGHALAVGAATARALRAAGLGAVDAPARMDSEGLLQLPALNPPPPCVGLLSGAGGRGLIERALRERGVEVRRVDLYARQPRRWPAALRRSVLAARAPTALLVSSQEALAAALAHPGLAACLPGWTAVVPSERLEAACRDAGLGHCVRAGSAASAAMLDALLAHAKRTPFR